MKTTNSIASILNSGSSDENADNDTPPNTYRVYLGTTAENDRCGIYMATLDLHTGTLSSPVRVSQSVRPGFIEIHPDGKYLYATDAGGNFSGNMTGAVSAYRIQEEDGSLIDLNTQSSGGAGPCHVSIGPRGKYLLVANYRGGSCAMLPIQSNGSLAASSSLHKHSGSSIHPARQTEAHTHSIICDPLGHFALTADLGLDQILIYRMDALAGHLTPSDPAFIQTPPGSGPRHLTFSPCGKFVYACMELNNTVIVYGYDVKRGTLEELQNLSTLPDDFKGENTTSEILTSQDGRFLYVGNRGHNSIAIFKIDPQTGLLSPDGYESTRGDHPRNFNIDPTGHFLLVANANSDNLVVFEIDPESGQLKFNGCEVNVPRATCIRFLAIPAEK